MALFLIDDPLAPWYWGELPKGRRPRKLEHARRARLIREWRNRLVATFIQRLHQQSGFSRQPPSPPHPQRCIQLGALPCPFCEAIREHRRGVLLTLGIDPRIPNRYFWP